MTFEEALKTLNIEDYGERILNSNSHGELIHIADYFVLAEALGDAEWFREWFEDVVKRAEKSLTRPETIFQHILRCLKDTFKEGLNVDNGEKGGG